MQPLAIKDSSAWAGLAKLATLEAVFIDRSPFSEVEVDHQLSIPSLRSITLGIVNVTDTRLLTLATAKNLKAIGVKPCAKVTDDGIVSFK